MQEHETSKSGTQPEGENNDSSGRRDGRYEPRPGWVLALVAVGVVLAVLVLVLLLSGGGQKHGPGRHGGQPAAPASAQR
jgi:hypothetical protein